MKRTDCKQLPPTVFPCCDLDRLVETHTSTVMHRLVRDVPGNTFTLEWLIARLPDSSFGVILLFLAIFSVVPVISIPARILILVLIFEILVGYEFPVLPRRWLQRPLRSRYLGYLERYVIPVLEKLETFVQPRWYGLLMGMRRTVALIAFLLTLISLLSPFPFSNEVPSLICVMMALAYIERDGLLFLAAFILGCAFLVAVLIAITFAVSII